MVEIVKSLPNLSAGELDPTLFSREDLDFYDKGLRRARNIVCLPTGGFTDRGGFVHIGYIRNEMDVLDLSGGVLSKGSGTGGTGPNFALEDGERVINFTDITAAGSAGVMHLDAGAAIVVSAVDVIDFTAPGAAVSDAFQIEYSADNLAWQVLGTSFDAAGDEPQSRRAALVPGETVAARYWRLRPSGGLAGRAISARVKFWAENATLSPVKLFGFAYDTEAQYLMAHTHRNIEVYNNRVRVASIAVPHAGEDVATVTRAQSLDTLLQFHANHQPWKVLRYGAATDWDGRALALENIPREQFDGATYVNGKNEKQEVLTLKMDAGTDRFNLAYAGKVSPAIFYAGDNQTTADNIRTALEQVEDIGVGNVTCTKVVGSSNIFEVEFVGDLGQQEHPVLSWTFLGPGTGDELLQVSRVAEGEEGGEDIMSASRGWPSCGTFAKGRLLLGGLRSRPGTVLMSVLGDYFNFDEELTGDGALSLRIDDDQAKRIRQIYPGRSLGIFTDDAEFWITDRVIAKGSPVSFARGSRRGVKVGLDVLEVDDRTLFLQADGRAVRAFAYSEDLQSFDAPSVSRLSPHLVDDPADWAVRRAGTQKGADMVFMANASGRAAVFSMMADEEFFAWHDWDTSGRFLAFGTEGADQIYAATERTVNGATTRRLEVYDESVLHDAAVVASLSPAGSSLEGLEHLEGETVELWLDGRPWGTAQVAGGSVSFPVEAGDVSDVQLGLGFAVEAQPLDARDARFGSVIGRKCRYVDVELALIGTGSVQVEANGRPVRKVDLRRFGEGAFDTVTDTLFTGSVKAGPFMGYADGEPPRISQPFRAPLHVSSLAIRARFPNV